MPPESDDEFDYDEDDAQEQPPPPPRESADIRALRKKAKKADELEAKLAALERRSVFAEVFGPQLTKDRKLELFLKAYDGELTADAVRTAAVDYGFLEEAGGGEPSVPEDELAAHGRIAGASTGTRATTTQDLAEALASAKSQDEVLDMWERAGFHSTRTLQ